MTLVGDDDGVSFVLFFLSLSFVFVFLYFLTIERFLILKKERVDLFHFTFNIFNIFVN